MFGRSARFCGVAATLAVFLGASTAHAQQGGNIDLSGFRPAMDSRGYLTVNASQMLGHTEFSFGLGALDWGYKLASFENGTNEYSVDNIITATLIGAFGLKAGPLELEFGVSVPLRIMGGDRGPDSPGPTDSPNDDQQFNMDGQGLGNLGLHFKTRILKTSRKPGIGVGLVASVFLDTTDPNDRWLGENQLVPQIMGIIDKEFGRERRLRRALNGGIRIRSERTFVDNDASGTPPAPTTGGTITAANELPFGFAVAYAISKQKFDLVGELIGSVPLGNSENYQKLEAIGGVKLYLARNSFLSLGAGAGLQPDKGGNPDVRAFIGIVFEPNIGDRDGDGLKDDVDKCPDNPEDFDGFEDEDGCPEPDNDRDGIVDEDDDCPLVPEDKDGFQDEDGCPEGDKNDRDGDGILDHVDACPDDPEDFDDFEDEDGCPELDNDKDGILDVDDLCPNDAEDRDGFEDEDGCPDLDNDKDRILDTDDRCPNEPETYNGKDDEDGCPDNNGITKLDDGGITILEPIEFEFNSAKIRATSHYILDAVVATMNGNPDITLLEVQGHTDERGDDAYNLDLSIRRAASVMQYLTSHGVDDKRLSSEGYGETQPVDRRHTQQAWAKNRRVEFVILKRALID